MTSKLNKMTSEYLRAKRELSRYCMNIDINASNLFTILKHTMEIVELTKVKGKEQKTMCLELLNDLIKESDISDKNSLLKLTVSEGPLEKTID